MDHLTTCRLVDESLRRFIVCLRFAGAPASADLPAEIVKCSPTAVGGGRQGAYMLFVLPVRRLTDPRVQARRPPAQAKKLPESL